MRKWEILTNNAIKILACLFMLCDHVGALLLPKVLVLRAIGRLAYPLFAYMFAEGCYYTKNKWKHAIILGLFAIVIQIVYFVFDNSFDLSIMAIFFISLGLIRLFDLLYNNIQKKNTALIVVYGIIFAVAFGIVLYVTRFISPKVTHVFEVNYGFYGIITPVVIYILKRIFNEKYIMMFGLAAMITLKIIFWMTPYSALSYLALIILFFYNGERGKWKLKYFFYIFYPAHMVLIYLIYLLVHR